MPPPKNTLQPQILTEEWWRLITQNLGLSKGVWHGTRELASGQDCSSTNSAGVTMGGGVFY